MPALPDVLIPPTDLATTVEVVAATQFWLERAVIGRCGNLSRTLPTFSSATSG